MHDNQEIDITRVRIGHAPRKAGERAPRESEERFRQLASAMPQLAWMARPNGWDFLVQRPLVRPNDEFLATLSHELRTPLNAILGWTHLIGARALAEDAARQGLQV